MFSVVATKTAVPANDADRAIIDPELTAPKSPIVSTPIGAPPTTPE
jgi:hypothetical protein